MSDERVSSCVCMRSRGRRTYDSQPAHKVVQRCSVLPCSGLYSDCTRDCDLSENARVSQCGVPCELSRFRIARPPAPGRPGARGLSSIHRAQTTSNNREEKRAARAFISSLRASPIASTPPRAFSRRSASVSMGVSRACSPSSRFSFHTSLADTTRRTLPLLSAAPAVLDSLIAFSGPLGSFQRAGLTASRRNNGRADRDPRASACAPRQRHNFELFDHKHNYNTALKRISLRFSAFTNSQTPMEFSYGADRANRNLSRTIRIQNQHATVESPPVATSGRAFRSRAAWTTVRRRVGRPAFVTTR